MIVPYGYEEINNIDGRRDRTASNLGPFQYSETEQQWMEETGSPASRTSSARTASAAIISCA